MILLTILVLSIISKIYCQQESESFAAVEEQRVSKELLDKIYSYTKNSKLFYNYTKEDTEIYLNEINAWVSPKELETNLPFYLAGYDFENRPVWIFEVGKYDFRKYFERGEETILQIDRYMMKGFIYLMQSLLDRDRPGDEIRQAMFVADMDEFEMRQVVHVPTIAQLMKFVLKYRDLYSQYFGGLILLNANYATKVGIDIARPLVGNLMEKIEILDNRKALWLPRLLRRFPMEILPPWYGGNANFKPLRVVG